MKKGSLVLVIVVVALLLIMGILAATIGSRVFFVQRTFSTPPITPNLMITYLFTAEATYEGITVKNGKLGYTHFKDTTGKCKTWVAQEPCWSPNDLVTEEATLSNDELTELNDIIGPFMDTATMDPPEGIRYYTYQLNVVRSHPTLEGMRENEVLYYSYPSGPTMPNEFKTVRDTLYNIVTKKFGAQ